MKFSKKKKIIISLIGSGIILGSSIGIALPLLVNKEEDKVEPKKVEPRKIEPRIFNSIKEKIENKNLIIPKNIRTFSDDEILLAIKNELKVKNPFLNDEDLSKITDNIWHLKPGKKTPVVLKIKLENGNDLVSVFVTKEKNIKLWTKNSAIVKNSNIRDGWYSSFIQDSSGNLWSMGGRNPGFSYTYPTKLQVLERDGEQWKQDTNNGLTKGSNINDGTNGVIFEDDFGNIWSMAKGTKLQVLVKNKDGTFAESWANDNGEGGEKLLQGSKIRNGDWGKIFQDSFGNLWAMGKRSKLQVLVKKKNGSYADSWSSDNSKTSKELLKNSNINNGREGQIFQDSFGNLWSMAYSRSYTKPYTPLQVLRADPNSPTGYVNTGWTWRWWEGMFLLKNSNIIRGQLGTIFQDSFGNLWTSGNARNVQVLKAKPDGTGYVNTGWTNDNTQGLLRGSNVVATRRQGFPVETIFQDSFGNLWMAANGKEPQVLKANSNSNGYLKTGWTSSKAQGLLKNLNTKGCRSSWVFFQDSFKNLWALGHRSKLQVLKARTNGKGYVDSWTDNINNEKLLKNSKIIRGLNGTIFEDSSKNLWSMGDNSKLQVYDKTQGKWIS